MIDPISDEVRERVHNVGNNLWHDVITNKYYFSDESYDIQGPYDTLAEANAALTKYCTWLNNPVRKDSEND